MMGHVGCESGVYCVTQGLLFFFPLGSSLDIARGPKSNSCPSIHVPSVLNMNLYRYIMFVTV